MLADTVCSNEHTASSGITFRGALTFGECESMTHVGSFYGYALEAEGTDGANNFESGVYVDANHGGVHIQSAQTGNDGTIYSGAFSKISVYKDEIRIDAYKSFLFGLNTQYIVTNELMVAQVSDLVGTSEGAIRSVSYKGLTGWIEVVKINEIVGSMITSHTKIYLHFVHGILVEATTAYDESKMTEWLI